MKREVKLPDLGEDAEDEATVSYWQFEEGDRVEKDDDLVEMTTDKAVFNVEATVTGILTQILAEEGDVVQVGETIAIIEQDEVLSAEAQEKDE